MTTIQMSQAETSRLQMISKLVALAIRNEIEDLHGIGIVLDDDGMARLNPRVRNAVFTCLCALIGRDRGDSEDTEWVDYLMESLPEYWEDPVLLERR